VDKVYLITGNSEKLESARHAFKDTGLDLEQLDVDIPEVQADSSLEVARHTVEQVVDDYDVPVIREDHSVYLNAFPGFPGPYMSYFDQKLPVQKLLDMLEGADDRTGYFEISAVVGMPDNSLKEYSFQIPIEITEEPRGTQGNWNRVMKLPEKERTFSETDSSSRIEIWNQNYRRIAEDLEE
jgi:non-canonical purine NTP pyrophosphatase (RdgB/HAM1 family)